MPLISLSFLDVYACNNSLLACHFSKCGNTLLIENTVKKSFNVRVDSKRIYSNKRDLIALTSLTFSISKGNGLNKLVQGGQMYRVFLQWGVPWLSLWQPFKSRESLFGAAIIVRLVYVRMTFVPTEEFKIDKLLARHKLWRNCEYPDLTCPDLTCPDLTYSDLTSPIKMHWKVDKLLSINIKPTLCWVKYVSKAPWHLA